MLITSLLQSGGFIYLLYFIIALLIAFTFHEFAHAWVSKRLGDPTPEMLGRVTLNPIAHLDLMGTIFLLFVGFGWGKPVPFNPRYFKNPRRDIFLTALAGPATNFILALIFALPFRIGEITGISFFSTSLAPLFLIIIDINIILGVFNLLPIPPLDGSKILYLFLSAKRISEIEQFGPYLLFGLIFLALLGGTDILGQIIFGVAETIKYLFVIWPG